MLKSALPHTVHGLVHFVTKDFWPKLFFSLPPALHDYNILSAQRLLLLLPLCYLIFLPQVRQRADYRYILIVLMGATLAHIAFAFPANFPRYEDYLIGCSTMIVGTMVALYGRSLPWLSVRGACWVAAVLGVLLLVPFLIRSQKTFKDAKQYCVNIYEQQYQMAQFVHRYYDSVPIAMNDIGAISFYSKGDKLDLWGLASLEVAKSKQKHYYTPAFLRFPEPRPSHPPRHRLRHLVRLRPPPPLDQVASWHNQNNVVLGGDSVSFYSINPAEHHHPKTKLQAFQPSLPIDVGVRYY